MTFLLVFKQKQPMATSTPAETNSKRRKRIYAPDKAFHASLEPMYPPIEGDDGTIIEDWPHHRPHLMPHLRMDRQLSTASAPSPRVTFNKKSTLTVYDNDAEYLLTKSYNSSERREITSRMIRDAVQVKSMLRSRPRELSGSLTKHLRECNIEKEMLIGVEHLVLDNPRAVSERRRAHRLAVLAEQQKQRKSGCIDQSKIAELSRKITKKPVTRARCRAALAA